MKSYFLLLIFCCGGFVSFAQNNTYWQQHVNYKIDVSLNDVENTLSGFESIEYINNSPDTLHFIWIHLWPNAYKNDRTAFSEQLLENGRTDFYFSNNDKKGYINRLNFKVNNTSAFIEDHSIHQDIVKLILPEPLAPNSMCKIETPFHVKLPYTFSRSGQNNQSYHITQWFPKAAVYDKKGWHPMPYLDQGEFYSDFGNYKVSITIPKNYIVAATGELQNKDEQASYTPATSKPSNPKGTKTINSKTSLQPTPTSDKQNKTLVFKQNNVVDFAWFASKIFLQKHDTIKLSSGKVVDLYAYYYSKNEANWQGIISYIKKAILTKSEWLGEYPYNTVSVVDDIDNSGGGMEYPTITLLSDGGNKEMLDFVVNHEVGHNWFQGILASNERQHPWMDEGINTYYDNRYSIEKNGKIELPYFNTKSKFLKQRLPDDIQQTILSNIIKSQKDQPIETTADSLTEGNSNFITYTKTGNWLLLLEQQLGKSLFDKCMQAYYQKWKFKHPYPEDFIQILTEISNHNLTESFSLLQKKGSLTKEEKKQNFKVMFLGSLKETNKNNYLFYAPIIGYNFYDKLMPGLSIHNYTLPTPNLQFIASAMYGSASKAFTGIAKLNYTIYPSNNGSKFDIGLTASSFNRDTFTDSTNTKKYQRFSKLVPTLKYTFANTNARSSVLKYIQLKSFFINEVGLNFDRDTVRQIDIVTYPVISRYLNQLEFSIENNRVLYPYRANLQMEQSKDFARLNFNANYFFNYAKGGGLNMRLFAGKFFYIGDKTTSKQFATDPYQLNMTGPKGYEDYTYSNYFCGRNEFEGLASQQIMIRDGGFKVRTDLLSNKIGKTDKWLAAANLTTTIPDKINPLSVLPVKLPVRLFLDIGTYADAWQKNAETGKFIYDAGFQLSLIKNTINIYFPIIYSKVYKNYFLSTIPDKRFIRNISFSIDVQNLTLRRLFPQLPF